MREANWNRVWLLVGSLLLSLGLAEVALRLRVDTFTILRWDGDEDLWKYLWNRGSTRSNPRLVHSGTLGWRPRPGYRTDQFTLNSRGLRGAREYPYEKGSGERRIVAVGDSFTFGSVDPALMAPIPDEAVYTARLEQSLPGVSVLNLGVDGYGTDQLLLYLREEGFKYSPDLVILSVYVDDLVRATLSFRDYQKPKFELEAGKLVLTGVPVPPPEGNGRNLAFRLPRLYTWTLMRHGASVIAKDWLPLGSLEVDRLNGALLNDLREDVRQRGARLLVVLIPAPNFATKVDRGERFLERWCRQTGVAFLSFRQELQTLPAHRRAMIYPVKLTPEGHSLLAEAIRKRIFEDEDLRPAVAQEGVGLDSSYFPSQNRHF